MKADPNRKTREREEEQYHGKPTAGARQVHRALKWMRTRENNVAGAREHEHPFQKKNENKIAKQPITKNRAASRGENKLSYANSQRRDNGSRPEDREPPQWVRGKKRRRRQRRAGLLGMRLGRHGARIRRKNKPLKSKH